ncbi:hybrid sensor histidine kinase/response regulator [Chitinophaga sp. sic0106]|uniref:ATP-binding response regulator n=1 Tax=Chitinophaga sp. sic0106 TaxID=2854785 RepID=UPI001C493772|nr:hybrid sensor histidine kinase/response regulator [Chitinophaga sp. sic0106]MBV7530340.1 hybrid sensor histidine kinase/response regulator [Chitinophaga sp. sic0106]
MILFKTDTPDNTGAPAIAGGDGNIVITTLSILAAALTFCYCALLFAFTKDPFFMIMGTATALAYACLLILVEMDKKNVAAICFIVVTNVAAMLLAVGKGAIVGETMLSVFLIIFTLLLFKQTRPILISSVACVMVLLVIKLNFRTGFLRPIPENGLQSVTLFKDICAFCLFILTTAGVAFFSNHVNRLIKALKASNTALKKALDEKSILSQVLSHEIRNPLHSLTGITEVLTREIETKEVYLPLLEYMHDLNTSSSYAMSVVNNFLELEQSQRQQSQPEIFAPAEWLKGIARSFQYQADRKHVKLIVETDDEVPGFIYACKTSLNKIVINLVVNAIKFTRDNTVVTITLAKQEDRLLLKVRDRGLGMSKEKMSKIFNLYETEQNSFLKGTGIGLYVAGTLSKVIGGSLVLDSIESKGSTFTLSFPLIAAAAPPLKPVVNEASLKGLKVLSVDDDSFSQKYLRRYFDDTGIQVKQAYSGKEGLETAWEWQPDIILLDAFLGDMTGHDIMQQIQSLSPKSRIIVVSGSACEKEQLRFLDEGAENYLLKPLPKKALFAAIGNEYTPGKVISAAKAV